MTLLPTITLDGRIRLRPLTRDDAQAIFDYSSDEVFCRYLATTPPRELSESEQFIEGINRENGSGQRRYWGVEYKGRIAGTIGLLNIDNQRSEAEIGFGIARELWGSGVVNRAIESVIDYGCTTMGLQRLLIGTHPENERACRFAEKSGFLAIGLQNGRSYFEHRCP